MKARVNQDHPIVGRTGSVGKKGRERDPQTGKELSQLRPPAILTASRPSPNALLPLHRSSPLRHPIILLPPSYYPTRILLPRRLLISNQFPLKPYLCSASVQLTKAPHQPSPPNCRTKRFFNRHRRRRHPHTQYFRPSTGPPHYLAKGKSKTRCAAQPVRLEPCALGRRDLDIIGLGSRFRSYSRLRESAAPVVGFPMQLG